MRAYTSSSIPQAGLRKKKIAHVGSGTVYSLVLSGRSKKHPDFRLKMLMLFYAYPSPFAS